MFLMRRVWPSGLPPGNRLSAMVLPMTQTLAAAAHVAVGEEAALVDLPVATVRYDGLTPGDLVGHPVLVAGDDLPGGRDDGRGGQARRSIRLAMASTSVERQGDHAAAPRRTPPPCLAARGSR